MPTQPFAEIDQPFDKSVTRIVLPKRIDDRLVMVDEITVFVIQPSDAGRRFLHPQKPVPLHRVAPIQPACAVAAYRGRNHRSIAQPLSSSTPKWIDHGQ